MVEVNECELRQFADAVPGLAALSRSPGGIPATGRSSHQRRMLRPLSDGCDELQAVDVRDAGGVLGLLAVRQTRRYGQWGERLGYIGIAVGAVLLVVYGYALTVSWS